MKRKIILAVLAVLLFVFSLGLMLYPLISSTYNKRHQSETHAQYTQQMAAAEEDEKARVLAQAQQYNTTLATGWPGLGALFSDAYLLNASEDYTAQLNLLGNGVMGYVVIPKIEVNLPILHGTGSTALANGVGHLLGSSLPVGGESTHTVLTGHSGMANNRMFSDLPELELGDIFYLEVLGEKLYYEVDQITTVLPYDTDQLNIVPDEDYCTLITCTPFGINTHRLLVRGTRVYMDEAEEQAILEEPKAGTSTWGINYIKGIAAGVAVFVLALLCLGIWAMIRRYRREKKK